VRNTLTKDHVTDTGCSLKVYRRERSSRIKMYRGMHRFLPTLIRTEATRSSRCPSGTASACTARRSTDRESRALRPADVLAVRWMRARTIRTDRRPYGVRAADRRTGGGPMSELSRSVQALPSDFWAFVGFAGQALFTRASSCSGSPRRKKESVMPIAFWYFSIIGGSISLIYAIAIGSLPVQPRTGDRARHLRRNLQLIRRKASLGVADGRLARRDELQPFGA
jgi:lipid-A-disaccharide synthase-like uncharacterized protein